MEKHKHQIQTLAIISGFDPTGLAGYQADYDTLHQLGITAEYHYTDRPIDFRKQTGIVKIGAIQSYENGNLILDYLKNSGSTAIVDPVLMASSGEPLFSESLQLQINLYLSLLPYTTVFTPNIEEACVFLQTQIQHYDDIVMVAKQFIKLGAKSVLIKGGHYHNTHYAQDYWTNGLESFWLAKERLPSFVYRGTGCRLSKAIAAALSCEYSLKDAIVIAKMILHQGLRTAIPISTTTYQLGPAHWPSSSEDLPYLTPYPTITIQSAFQTYQTGLYPIVNRFHWIERLARLGIKSMQLRIKDLVGKFLENEIWLSIEYSRQHQIKLFINDFWELALHYKASAIHLGQEDLATADINAIHNSGALLGVSTHCYHEVARAHSIFPSYLACGPIFPTCTKSMAFQPQGINAMAHWLRILPYPLVAIGGMNSATIPLVLKQGLKNIAVVSAITESHDPEASTKTLLHLIETE